MICLTNFLNKQFPLRFLLVLLFLGTSLTGCAGVMRKNSGAQIISVTAEKPSPQKAGGNGPINWSVTATSGVGTLTYEFRLLMGGIESIEQRGASPRWSWTPRTPGSYRVKVRIWDSENHSTESGWSDEYLITPAINNNTVVAFLPVENLADVKAPLQDIGNLFSELLKPTLKLLPTIKLENFMQVHRMRNTGGISSMLAKAMREETGAAAVFITSLETWHEGASPRVSLISRLVTTDEEPEIIWMDSVGLSGDDAPGLLGIGRINSSQELMKKALEQLVASFQAYLVGNAPIYRHAADRQGVSLTSGSKDPADGPLGTVKGRYQPQFSYRASTFDPAGNYRVAVVPFLNINARKHAGEIIALHTVKQLLRYDNIRVFEPGRIRETLLKYRMIMQSGPSLAASDILTNADILGADIVVSGSAFGYQGDVGESKVDFSMLAFDGTKREVVWASRSHAAGNDGVYFFDWGKILSAHGLTSRMTRAVISLMEE